MTVLGLTGAAPEAAKASVLVVFVEPAGADGAAPTIRGALPDGVARQVQDGLRVLRGRGKTDEATWLTGIDGIAAEAVLAVGLGESPHPPETLRRAAGAAARHLVGRDGAAVVLPEEDLESLAAIAEGLAIGAYRFIDHRGSASRDKLAEGAPVASIDLLTSAAGAGTAIERAGILADAVHLARDLVNTAPNVLYPESFADKVVAALPPGVSATVDGPERLAELGCGGVLAVGQGSAYGPRVVHLSYAPEGAKAHLAYVGKGVTFDSGGISLKPAPGMDLMKSDMGGAAAVVGAVFAIARLGLPVRIDGWVGLAENMPDGASMRPGDVITMAGGTTVEIMNTDAEGRLVLGDILVRASQLGPDAMVDIATLTGGAVVAMGHRTALVFANDDDFQAEVTAAAVGAGETVWPMPIAEESRRALDSQVADIINSGVREGQPLLAAAFLRDFVGRSTSGEPVPWVHMDIAGPAFSSAPPYGYVAKGGTGFGVRTLVVLAESRL